MESAESTAIACWHCGAPMQPVQRHCLTCGATREYVPGEFGAPAVKAATEAPPAAGAPEAEHTPNVAPSDA